MWILENFTTNRRKATCFGNADYTTAYFKGSYKWINKPHVNLLIKRNVSRRVKQNVSKLIKQNVSKLIKQNVSKLIKQNVS